MLVRVHGVAVLDDADVRRQHAAEGDAPYEYFVHLAISMAASAASPDMARRPPKAGRSIVAAPRRRRAAAAKLIVSTARFGSLA